MARCRSLALVVLFGAAFSFGCASNKKAESAQVAPAATPVAHEKVAAPAAKAAPKAAATKAAAAPSAKPAPKAKAPAGKPSAKAGAKPTNVAAKPSAKPGAKVVVATAPKAKSAPRPQPSGPPGLVVSLGAGDSLGKAVYINDVIIAARTAKRQTEFAEVQPKEGGN
jgi:hypothetical protein